MSLQIAAKHLAAQGRGPDTTLVHMAPREVAGLQAIAKAHGGSLTINPQTGLAEAGFLSRILPTLAGAALAATGVGAPMAALMVGGGTMLANGGDLKSGLMAGLGAYGGAGLGQGVFGATEAAAPPVEAVQAPVTAPAAATPPPMSAASTGFTATPANPGLASLTPEQYAAQANSTASFGNTVPFEPRPGVTLDNYAQQGFGTNNASSLKAASDATTGTGTGWDRFASNLEAKPTYGLAAAAPMVNTERAPLAPEEHYTGPLSKYSMSKDYKSYDPTPPNPYYRAQYQTYAGGGPVEQMSNAAAIGQNTGYPTADINHAAYATPWQTPISENVVQGTADTGVNRVTGEQTFAGGGITGQGGIDVHVPLSIGSDGGGFGGGGFQGGFQAMGSGNSTMQQPQNASMGGMGGMGATQNPFEGDSNWQNYQSQMQGMMNDFQNSDQYKNMDQLRQTMLSYQQQRMGQMQPQFAEGGVAFAHGGQSNLGGYSDGGRMLKGPGDGMSDSIPAQIGSKQPARLADGEFVVPADVVSHLGNGSTDAGAKQLYAMMDRIRSARTGKKKQAPKVNPAKAMPV
jgi:hypothetical protein